MPQRRRYTPSVTHTAIAMMYQNKSLIADRVMPRVISSPTELFTYIKHDLAQGFTVPSTLVGRRGKPNEVSFTGEEVEASTSDYALDDPIPQSDIDNADARFDPVNVSTEYLTNLLMLDREVRVSNIAFNAANYAAANVEALAAGDRFDDPDSNPLIVMMDALKTPVMRPTTLTFGEDAWTAFSMNPFVVKAAHGNSGDAGIASIEAVAKLLRVRDILIGEARVNTARKGQAIDLAETWGNKVAMHYQDQTGNNRGTTWGYTQPYKTKEASNEYDRSIGARGGTRVRVIDSVKEVVSAKDLGFLLEDVTTV